MTDAEQTPEATTESLVGEPLPPEVLATRDRYLATFPMWSVAEGPAAEEKARRWNIGLAKQIVFEHPDQGYGCKRNGATNPVSKDTLAQQVGAALYGWDMLSGAGTGTPTSNANPLGIDITGQDFEHVEGYDVIKAGGQKPEPTPPPAAAVPPYNEDYSIQFGNGCNDAYAEAKQSGYDSGMVAVHASRAAWDYYSGKLTWDESYKLHLNDFRREYGLPPL